MEANTISLQAEAAFLAGRTAPNVNGAQTLSQMRRVAQDFEAFFLSQMLQPLFQNLQAEQPYGGGHAETMWRQLQVDEYGKAMAKAGGIGIADMVMNEMLKLQEGQNSHERQQQTQ